LSPELSGFESSAKAQPNLIEAFDRLASGNPKKLQHQRDQRKPCDRLPPPLIANQFVINKMKLLEKVSFEFVHFQRLVDAFL
jgi:hypothetical protein